jgi:ADP-heptose:LPS heptosyltransferase
VCKKSKIILEDMHKTTIFYTKVLILLSFVVFPLVYFFISKRSKKVIDLRKVNILLVPQLTRIGDIVCSTPVFRAIKEKYPDSHVTVLSSLNAYEIIKNNPRIDEIIIIEDWQNNFLGLLKKIKNSYFDWSISFSGSALSSVLFFYGLIPNRLKITRRRRPLAEIFSDYMCNQKERYLKLTYLPIFYLKMLSRIGINYTDDRKEVFLSSDPEKKIDTFLEKKNILLGDKLLGISLTAGNKIKEWGDDKFETLCREINKKYNIKIIFIGSVRDYERIEKVVGNLGDKNSFINGVGFTVEELPNLMSHFSFFIAVDTGPTHVAYALGIPLIDILGPVNDIELTPRGDNVKIVKSPLNLPPSVFAFEESLDQGVIRKSIDSITVEQVLGAFDSLIKKEIK